MTVVREAHEAHGATFEAVAGRAVPAEYGRAARTHRAVRNAVGVTEHAFDVLVVSGDDRREFVDDTVTNRVPTEDGEGAYALLLDPQGRIRVDCYVFATGDSLLLFLPFGEGGAVAEEWNERTFVQDVDVELATDDFGTFGVHGPKATEKVASVLHHASPPEERLTFVRGEMEAGVTVVRDDDLAGEEGYLVVCGAEGASDVFETLLVRGLNAVPFGRRTWETLTLEAGTPLFETELRDRIPNVVGLRNAVDFEKGCFVGQEVVSKVENRGEPSSRLVGLTCETLPDAGATVTEDGEEVGEVTRAAESPTLEEPLALAFVDYDVGGDAGDGALAVETDGGDASANLADLPFVDGGERSARLPTYE
ncbi:CAF17-like 4Fe-4S cluster assembly/insertion protein YgfZ [Halobacterium litoreum]|uniref:Aminomethyltransferase family protein n=1 Tax=Halobacterium litoreum TaxID=2039234 RepID=A0ABD5NG55_9EURY|nr:aminomethyltransferase family protein [Halobacterium litoreum]UHH12999.1 aminomethyltransferase family protein [Halobacterium litoreum]